MYHSFFSLFTSMFVAVCIKDVPYLSLCTHHWRSGLGNKLSWFLDGALLPFYPVCNLSPCPFFFFSFLSLSEVLLPCTILSEDADKGMWGTVQTNKQIKVVINKLHFPHTAVLLNPISFHCFLPFFKKKYFTYRKYLLSVCQCSCLPSSLEHSPFPRHGWHLIWGSKSPLAGCSAEPPQQFLVQGHRFPEVSQAGCTNTWDLLQLPLIPVGTTSFLVLISASSSASNLRLAIHQCVLLSWSCRRPSFFFCKKFHKYSI